MSVLELENKRMYIFRLTTCRIVARKRESAVETREKLRTT